MYHSMIKPRVRELGLLHSVMVELTYRCNLDCFFCYNDKQARGTELGFELYRQLFADLARMQAMFMTFTGGEPMVHPRFFDLGALAREHGFVVRIRTNGHSLRPPIVHRLIERVDPFSVDISLHGASALTHDRQTQVSGSFARLLDNLETLGSQGVRTSLISTLTTWNEHEIEAMFDLADSLEMSLSFQGPVGPRVNGDTCPLSLQPSAEAWKRFREIVTSRRSEAKMPEQDARTEDCANATDLESSGRSRLCGIGSDGLTIDPFGNVLPCQQLHWPAGNLHEKGIEEIWPSSPVFVRARGLSAHAAERFRSKEVQQFGAPVFCPAVAVNCATGCPGCTAA